MAAVARQVLPAAEKERNPGAVFRGGEHRARLESRPIDGRRRRLERHSPLPVQLEAIHRGRRQRRAEQEPQVGTIRSAGQIGNGANARQGDLALAAAVEGEHPQPALHVRQAVQHDPAADQRRILDDVRLLGDHDLPRARLRILEIDGDDPPARRALVGSQVEARLIVADWRVLGIERLDEWLNRRRDVRRRGVSQVDEVELVVVVGAAVGADEDVSAVFADRRIHDP